LSGEALSPQRSRGSRVLAEFFSALPPFPLLLCGENASPDFNLEAVLRR
jgi:hypothetical protein